MGKIIQFPVKNIEDEEIKDVTIEEDTIIEEINKDYNDYTEEEIDKMYADFWADQEWVEEFYSAPW